MNSFKLSDYLPHPNSESEGIADFPEEPIDENSPLLGQYLKRAGLISDVQLKAALHYQKFTLAQGKPELLGNILVSAGYISYDKLMRVLGQQNIDRRV
jgi:hypothetical protein